METDATHSHSEAYLSLHKGNRNKKNIHLTEFQLAAVDLRRYQREKLPAAKYQGSENSIYSNPDAAEVSISHCKNTAVTPFLKEAGLHSGDLQAIETEIEQVGNHYLAPGKMVPVEKKGRYVPDLNLVAIVEDGALGSS